MYLLEKGYWGILEIGDFHNAEAWYLKRSAFQVSDLNVVLHAGSNSVTYFVPTSRIKRYELKYKEKDYVCSKLKYKGTVLYADPP